ncbi:hypothetical protein [Mycolicibacterium austroafricanum]|uniref:hypothetical protein n=1 Tax=Mycolicibacterium austroafricanum TaxID=39687 RepID=UPI0005631C93|nr:hypothetical protein [Mycolicibacterium austroafricanum]QZY47784.1 hypothetical protein K5L12_08795 [Mycolicibacterium austroafricanum]
MADHGLHTTTLDERGSVEEMVASLRCGSDAVHIGVRVLSSGHYLVRIDHGIGDAAVIVEILAALSQASRRTGFVEPRPVVTTNHPFYPAIANALKKPSALYRGFRRAVVGHAAKPDRAPAQAPPGLGHHPSARADGASHVFVKSDDDFVAQLKDYRRRAATKVSLAAILIASISEAMRAQGVDIGDDVEVVADLRKYLPSGQATLANFVSVVAVPCPKGASPHDVGIALAAEVDSTTPLAKAIGALGVGALGRFRRRGRGKPAEAEPIPGQRVMLSFSDVTKLPMDTRIRWSDPDTAEMAVMLPFTSPERVSLCLVSLRGRLQVTAVFSARLVDPARVRTALERALSMDHIESLN